MKSFAEHLEQLQKIKRKSYYPSIHRIHKKYRISKKTLFYIKEYGQHSNVPRVIIRESAKILIMASVISAFGGLALENIKSTFLSIAPLIILLPMLNDMIGDYGTIVSSKFSAMLHEGTVNRRWWETLELRKLYAQIFVISLITGLLSCLTALIFSGSHTSIGVGLKVFLIVIIDVIVLVNALFLTAVLSGLHFFKEKEDPNNFLIPITTSIADFGNMILLSLLVVILF